MIPSKAQQNYEFHTFMKSASKPLSKLNYKAVSDILFFARCSRLQLYTFGVFVVFVGFGAGMREFNSGFRGLDRRSGTVRPPLASLVCVITAPLSSRRCFCGMASERLMA